MILVELFSKNDCHLCEEAKAVLETVRRVIPFTLKEIKLAEGDQQYEDYKELFPVVHINRALAFKYRVNENMLRIKLQQLAAAERRPDDEDASA